MDPSVVPHWYLALGQLGQLGKILERLQVVGEPAVSSLQVPAGLPEPAGPGLAPPGPPGYLLAPSRPPLASMAPLGLVYLVPKVALAIGLPWAVVAVPAGLSTSPRCLLSGAPSCAS